MSFASDFSSGKGGLEFTAQSPPGLGRLVRIPFYLATDQGNAEYQVIVPGLALQNNSTESPIVAAGLAGAAGLGPSVTMKTPEISWATLRLVGFESCINFPPNPGGAIQGASAMAAAVSANVTQLLVKDLKIGGGATLFVHEDYANASVYADTNDNFAGLRDYPLIKSPNVAEVEVSVFNQFVSGSAPAAAALYAGQATNIVFSLNLVCEILQDDNYGSHVPGPYARAGAMVRQG